ncbi:MAG: hypothetical protein CMQ24_09605 [Gammaproteobacteria bacterium]|nr:hypothetical protein [Gammaproteobacteria bacterium]
MSQQLTRSDLWSLEQYSTERAAFRAEVLAHKQHRRVSLGCHIMLIFEDVTTIRYQIQEMLRIEKVFEADAIQEELDAYNPLIPDGSNWKCTLLIAYDDPEERRVRLEQLLGVEDTIWLRVGDRDAVYPIADEDLDRTRDNKTSSVHFLRYELTADMVSAIHAGEALFAGVEHAAYPVASFQVADATRDALAADLDR